jgi:hypothetical protein
VEYFKSSADRDVDELVERIEDAIKLIPFNVPFLDSIFGGILPTDLFLVGAATGKGKTELVTDIGIQAALSHKRVHFFALEAENNEIERRTKYKVISQKYLADGGKEHINFQDWRLGKLGFLDDYEQAASTVLKGMTNLHTFYRDRHFNVQTFRKIFMSLEGKSDLVLVDHIHYFDLDSENENKEIGEIMKEMKLMSQILKIPIVLVAHMRKNTANKDKPLIESIDSFHGTSSLGKICTRSLVLSSGGIDGETKMPIVYFRAAKNRLGGERVECIGKTVYDTQKNQYMHNKIKYGRLSPNEKEFIPFTFDKPAWLR